MANGDTFTIEPALTDRWEEVSGPRGELEPYPYMVRSDGRVARIIRQGLIELELRTLDPYAKGGTSGDRYLAVDLRAEGEPRKQVYVHQLVAWEHLPRDPVGLHVDHKNGDPHDNSVDNLQLVTPDQNNLFSNGGRE